MCKIITILNRNQKNSETIAKIIKANSNLLSLERSGYSVFRNNQSFFYLGEKAYQRFEDNIAYKNEEVYILHTRTATAGSRDFDGLHLQPYQGFVFAHNGMVLKFNHVIKKNDSFYFFKRIINQDLTKDNIEKAINRYDFSGRGFLYNIEKKKLYIFSTNNLFVYGLPDCLIFSTFQLNLNVEKEEVREILGYPFVVRRFEEKIKIDYEDEIKDSFLVFENLKLIESQELNINQGYYYQGYNYTFGFDREDEEEDEREEKIKNNLLNRDYKFNW